MAMAPQPIDWCLVWQRTRSVLEVLYFISGVGIFVAACYAAKQVSIASRQLKLAKGIAEANSRRESVKLAAQSCKSFADEVVPAFQKFADKYRELNLTFLTPDAEPWFVLRDGEFQKATYDINKIAPHWEMIVKDMVGYLNQAEAFAIPFAAGVADDKIGFQETAVAFCSAVGECMPAVYFLRKTKNIRYPSLLTLFCIWNNRLAAEAMAPLAKQMQDFVNVAEKNTIKPI
jgi:hypothetical protein